MNCHLLFLTAGADTPIHAGLDISVELTHFSVLAAFFPATQVADKPRFTLSNTYMDSVYYTSPSGCAHERGHVVCNVAAAKNESSLLLMFGCL